MNITQLTYGAKNLFGQGSEEHLEITVSVTEDEDHTVALEFAKQFVLNNLNSLDNYSELGLLIEQRKQELDNTNILLNEANQKVSELDEIVKTVRPRRRNE